MRTDDLNAVEGVILGVDQTALHDGPGVRLNIYVKGCPLRCDWCHSPDSQRFEPEIAWYASRCSKCGRCVEACPEGLRGFDRLAEEARVRCTLCGRCVNICPCGALSVRGYETTAGDMAVEAAKLKPFFKRTGGGVTLTGGEPTAQADFAFAVAALCRAEGVHVAMETCGHASWETFERLAPVVDLFLYDVKHVADDLHRKHTGVPAERILANLERLVIAGESVVARVPLVPGFNDSDDAIRRIAGRLHDLGVVEITLLPFNPATSGKYSWIRRESPWAHGRKQSAERVASLEGVARGAGLTVVPA